MLRGKQRSLHIQLVKLSLVASVCVSLQGCGDKTLQRLSHELAVTSEGSPAKVQAFYMKLNSDNQKMDSEELKLKGIPELAGIELPSPGNFTNKYDQDRVINPRVKMAEMLNTYATKIDRVVNAKSIAEADQLIADLNSTVGKIGGDLLALDAIASNLPGAISTLIHPIKTIGGIGLQGAFAFVRENWARETITELKDAFVDVCINMQRDLKNSAESAKERANNIAHLRRIILDKKIKQNISEQERNKLLEEQTAAGTFASNVGIGNPADIFEHEKDLMEQLGKWSSEKTQERSSLKDKLLPWKR